MLCIQKNERESHKVCACHLNNSQQGKWSQPSLSSRELDSKLYKPGVTTELYIYLVQPGLLLLFVFVIFSYFSEVL